MIYTMYIVYTNYYIIKYIISHHIIWYICICTILYGIICIRYEYYMSYHVICIKGPGSESK